MKNFTLIVLGASCKRIKNGSCKKEHLYAYPYMPDGLYAEIRNASNMRFQVEAELTRCKNRIQRWFAVYFPEYREVYGSFDAISSMIILKQAALPCDIIKLGAEKINQIWREAKLRAVGCWKLNK